MWRPKTWGCRTVFDLMSHGDLRASLRRSYNFQGRRKVASKCPQGDRRGALRRTCGQTDGNECGLILFIFFLDSGATTPSCSHNSAGRSRRCTPVNHRGCTASERCHVPLHVPAGHTASKIVLCTQRLGGPAVRICGIFSAILHKKLVHGPSQ